MATNTERTIEDIEAEILRLDLPSRAALAKRLLDSLDTLSAAEYDQLWTQEAEARFADFRAGRTRAIDGDEVFAKARTRAVNKYS